MQEVLLVLCACPKRAEAERFSRSLVAEKAAACIHILPAGRSVYRWQGAVETAEECTLLVKTTAAAYPRLERRIREWHEYDLPEIVAFPAATGLAGYLDWVRASVTADAGGAP